jgi:hypothetical protein
MHPITFGDLWFGDHVTPHGPAHLTDSSTHQGACEDELQIGEQTEPQRLSMQPGDVFKPFRSKAWIPPRQSTPGDPQVCAGIRHNPKWNAVTA